MIIFDNLQGFNFWTLTIFIPDDVHGPEVVAFLLHLDVIGRIFFDTLSIMILENLINNCHHVTNLTDKDREGLFSLDLV